MFATDLKYTSNFSSLNSTWEVLKVVDQNSKNGFYGASFVRIVNGQKNGEVVFAYRGSEEPIMINVDWYDENLNMDWYSPQFQMGAIKLFHAHILFPLIVDSLAILIWQYIFFILYLREIFNNTSI